MRPPMYVHRHMGRNSSIEWTHHTFNPWWGCAKVSPACSHCYAEAWAKRVGQELWGRSSDRRLFGDVHWRAPVEWNAEAKKRRVRRRVFCASMADVFERRSELASEREKLWDLIEATPWLDWLLLTKRPQNIGNLSRWKNEWPSNVWLGTTVENQQYAEIRLPELLQYPTTRRFLSCEPLLGPVDLSPWIAGRNRGPHPIDWVIAGGESGPSARAMLPGWARRLRDQCRNANIPFHFKQWGHWAPVRKNKQRTVEFWDEVDRGKVIMEARGKKRAGRRLDGAFWNQIPKAA
jgi:protein gp37